MTGWDIRDDQFIDQIKARDAMSNIQNISNQRCLKRHYVEECCVEIKR